MRTVTGIAAIVIAFLFATLSSAPAFGANGQTTIDGVVYSASSGAPIAGAKLTLAGNGTSYSTTSDATGAFAFTNIQAGTWLLRTTAPLFALTVSSGITVAAGQTVDLSVALQPVTSTNITTLGHVTVRGRQALNTTAAAAVTLPAQQFVTTGTLQVEQLLEATPAISIEHFNNGAPGNVATLSIRGAGGFVGSGNTGYEVLVLQDGEPIRNGQFGDADLSGLTPAIYSRVEVVKGVGGTSLFGANTVGGTVNLVTIDPKAAEGAELLFTEGGFGTSDYNISQTNTYGRFGYVLDYHQYATDGITPPGFLVDIVTQCNPFFCNSPGPPTGAVLHPTTAMVLRSGLAKIRYDFSKTSYGMLTAADETDWRDQFGLLANSTNIFLSTTFTSFSTDTLGNPYYFGFPMDYVWNRNPKYSLDLHTTVGDGALMVRYYDNFIARWVDGNNEPAGVSLFACCFLQKSNDHLTGELVTWDRIFGNHDVTLAVGGNGDTFEFGACGAFSICTTSNSFPHNQKVLASDILATTGTQIERTALVRDDYEISSKFKTTLAAYYSNYNDLNVRRFDPRLAVVNRPNENTVVRFSVGSGFAAPRLSDVVAPIDRNPNDSVGAPFCPGTEPFCVAPSGNPSVKEESAFGYDLGYERTWGRLGDFSVDLYRTNLHDHIFTALMPIAPGQTFSDGTPILGISEPINLAGTIYQGIEFSGSLPVTDYFAVKGYYNTQSAYPVNVDLATQLNLGNVINNTQYLGVPLHKVGWSVNYQNTNGISGFVGGDWFGQNNSYNVPQFWVYNAGLTVPFAPSTSLHLAWHNIFNKDALIFSQFGMGVPYTTLPGFNGCPGSGPCTFPTNAFSYMPHTFSITLDERIGSLR
jgi:carboxypeptidase family protein/TonB-dependent receptor-like protein